MSTSVHEGGRAQRSAMRWVISLALCALLMVALFHLRSAAGAGQTMASDAVGIVGGRATRSPLASRELPAKDTQQQIRAELAAVLADMSSVVQKKLDESAFYPACVACRVAPMTDACLLSCSDALYQALAEGEIEERAQSDEFGARSIVASFGEAAAARELARVVAESSDEVDRVDSLILLMRSLNVSTIPLLPAAYTGLRKRSIVESQMIARWHRIGALQYPEAIDEMLALGASPDARARHAAMVALGHAATAKALSELLRSNPPTLTDANYVTESLGRCGIACIEGYRELLSAGDSEMRMAVYQAITETPTEDRAQLIALARTSARTVKVHSGDEREMLDQLFADTTN